MGGRAPDGNYYGSESLGPGEMEWYPPEEPMDVETVELDEPEPRFTEPYSGIVGGVDYKNSKRPGADPYEAGTGRLPPRKVSCPAPPDGCGAAAEQPCTFQFERVQGQMGNRKRELITGERRMACVARQRKADAT